METTRHQPELGSCVLEAAVDRETPCPAAACPIWDAPTERCALDGVGRELFAHSDVAAHLLELRRALADGAAIAADEQRARFFRRLNLENVHEGGGP